MTADPRSGAPPPTLQSEFDLHVERRELATTLAQIQPLAERQQRA